MEKILLRGFARLLGLLILLVVAVLSPAVAHVDWPVWVWLLRMLAFWVGVFLFGL